LEKALQAANVPALEFYRYDDCEHGFTNEDRPEVYNAAAAKEAWNRAYNFLRKHLAS